MSGKDLLPFSSTQAPDAYYTKPRFTRPSDSLFTYMGWVTKCNYAHRRRQMAQFGVLPSYGTTAVFRFDRSAFKRGPVQLRWTRSALTGAGGATFQRYVDFEGYATILDIEVVYGQNRLFYMTGEQLYLKHRMLKDQRESDAANLLVFGDQSVADRTTLAASAQTLTVDLPLYWTLDPSLYFIGTGTSHELEVRIRLRDLGSITNTDGTATPTGGITAMWLQPLDIYVEDDEKRWHHAQLESADGIHYLIEDTELQLNNLITAGQTSYQIQLSNFKGACKELIVVVRPDADRSATAPNPNNALFNYTQIGSMGVIASDVVVMDTLDDAYLRFYIWPLYHRGVPGDFIYVHPFAMAPENYKHGTGHKTWSAMTNPILTINFNSALAANQRVDLYSVIYNNIQHHVRLFIANNKTDPDDRGTSCSRPSSRCIRNKRRTAFAFLVPPISYVINPRLLDFLPSLATFLAAWLLVRPILRPSSSPSHKPLLGDPAVPPSLQEEAYVIWPTAAVHPVAYEVQCSVPIIVEVEYVPVPVEP
jgi:hypothetical protein